VQSEADDVVVLAVVLKVVVGLEEVLGGLEVVLGGLEEVVGGLEEVVGGLDEVVGGLEEVLGGLDEVLGGLEEVLGGMVDDDDEEVKLQGWLDSRSVATYRLSRALPPHISAGLPLQGILHWLKSTCCVPFPRTTPQ
jgi:hypothetical protein